MIVVLILVAREDRNDIAPSTSILCSCTDAEQISSSSSLEDIGGSLSIENPPLKNMVQTSHRSSTAVAEKITSSMVLQMIIHVDENTTHTKQLKAEYRPKMELFYSS